MRSVDGICVIISSNHVDDIFVMITGVKTTGELSQTVRYAIAVPAVLEAASARDIFVV